MEGVDVPQAVVSRMMSRQVDGSRCIGSPTERLYGLDGPV